MPNYSIYYHEKDNTLIEYMELKDNNTFETLEELDILNSSLNDFASFNITSSVTFWIEDAMSIWNCVILSFIGGNPILGVALIAILSGIVMLAMGLEWFLAKSWEFVCTQSDLAL